MLQAFTTLSCRKLFIPDAVHNSKTLQLLLCMLPWVSCLLERNENYLSMQGLLAFHDKKQFRAFWERMVEIIGMLTACILTRHIYFCVFMIVWVIMYCNSKFLVDRKTGVEYWFIYIIIQLIISWFHQIDDGYEDKLSVDHVALPFKFVR